MSTKNQVVSQIAHRFKNQSKIKYDFILDSLSHEELQKLSSVRGKKQCFQMLSAKNQAICVCVVKNENIKGVNYILKSVDIKEYS